jgi:quercetin dioxygenase-like cupin family protein
MQYFCDLENRETKETVPGVHIRTFWGNKMLLSIVDLAANVVVPAHSHPHEQAGTVISGEFEMTINGETRKLKPGILTSFLAVWSTVPGQVIPLPERWMRSAL